MLRTKQFPKSFCNISKRLTMSKISLFSISKLKTSDFFSLSRGSIRRVVGLVTMLPEKWVYSLGGFCVGNVVYKRKLQSTWAELDCLDREMIKILKNLTKGQTILQEHLVRKILKFMVLMVLPWGYVGVTTLYLFILSRGFKQ